MKWLALLLIMLLFPLASALELVGTNTAEDKINAQYVSSDDYYAYILNGFNTKQIAIFDVSDKSAPRQIGIYASFSKIATFHIQGDYAYIANSNRGYGFEIADISDRKNPTLIADVRFNASHGSFGIYFDNDYLYVVDYSNLHIYDVSDKATPKLLSSLALGKRTIAVTAKDDYAYVASEQKLKIIDVSDKSNPEVIGSTSSHLSYSPAGLEFNENYVYVADNDNGVRIINISDKSKPKLIATYDPGDAFGISVTEDIMYVASALKGLYEVDVSDPTNPSAQDSQDTAGSSTKPYYYNGYIYLADGSGGFQIYKSSLFAPVIKVPKSEPEQKQEETKTETVKEVPEEEPESTTLEESSSASNMNLLYILLAFIILGLIIKLIIQRPRKAPAKKLPTLRKRKKAPTKTKTTKKKITKKRKKK